MKNWLNRYFGFTKREYNGLLTLITIVLLTSVLPYFYGNYFAEAEVPNNIEMAALQKLVLVNQAQPFYYTKTGNAFDEDENKVESTLFPFDPNKIDVQQWQKLGLSLKQAQSIVNYCSKGGKFYKAEDLKKMYTITPTKYQQLEPYIEIDSKNLERKYPQRTPYPKREVIVVEINSADTLQLDKIKGIGAAFARRIIKYRERLGGFYKKEQLMEVFGLDSLKFEEISAQISLDPLGIKKININTAVFEDLKNHPYIKYKQINAIIQYRKQHGSFSGIDDLKKVAILTPQNLQALIPYLTF